MNKNFIQQYKTPIEQYTEVIINGKYGNLLSIEINL